MEQEYGRKEKRRLGDASKPVIERWARLKRRKWGYEFGRAIVRQKLLWTERKDKKALEQTFETFKYHMIKYEHGRFRSTYLLFNIGFYLLIALRDIQAVKRDALTHPNEWTRKLHARFILLTVYEWDADKVTGRSLKNALDTMMIADELKQEMVGVLRALRLVQRKVTKNYSFVRNATIGHRDPNALAQYRAIRDLDVDEVFEIGAEFFEAVRRFVKVQTQIISAGSTIQSYLRQWAESENSSIDKT